VGDISDVNEWIVDLHGQIEGRISNYVIIYPVA
jgi:hypothetical protein